VSVLRFSDVLDGMNTNMVLQGAEYDGRWAGSWCWAGWLKEGLKGLCRGGTLRACVPHARLKRGDSLLK